MIKNQNNANVESWLDATKQKKKSDKNPRILADFQTNLDNTDITNNLQNDQFLNTAIKNEQRCAFPEVPPGFSPLHKANLRGLLAGRDENEQPCASPEIPPGFSPLHKANRKNIESCENTVEDDKLPETLYINPIKDPIYTPSLKDSTRKRENDAAYFKDDETLDMLFTADEFATVVRNIDQCLFYFPSIW